MNTDKYKMRFMICWIVAVTQLIAACMMFGRAQTIQEETGSWMSQSLIISANLFIVALVAVILGYRTYRLLKAAMKEDKQTHTDENKE